MEQQKAGQLICRLRKERGMTQKQLADQLHISDRAVSKWERGQGSPDLSLWPGLSALLGVRIEALLAGDLGENPADGGNMKRIRFYFCPTCGGVATATGATDISCCGRTLQPLQAAPADEAHAASIRPVEDELLVSLAHPMEKGHFIAFAANVSYDRVQLMKLYPEQDAQVRVPA